MAENIFTKNAGHVTYIPDKVDSDTNAPVKLTYDDHVLSLGLQRDQVAADILTNDLLLDALDATIDDQMKNFALTVPELHDAAMNLCGSPTVNWECYKKAKELLRIAPWIAYGYDPVQLTFTDTFTPRVGNVVFDCKQFDPNKFHDLDNAKDMVDTALGTGQGLDPNVVQKAAQENQKSWALLVLFWDLLWGKPAVKPGIPDDEAKKNSIDHINKEIQSLRDKGNTAIQNNKTKQVIDTEAGLDPNGNPRYKIVYIGKDEGTALLNEADKLSKSLAQSKKLPNTIMVDRPRNADQLQWQGKFAIIPNVTFDGSTSLFRNPLDSGNAWTEGASAIWVDFGSFFYAQDHYKNRSIPALKSGFILSILIGFCSLIPKIGFFFIVKRISFLKSIKGVKNIPYAGKVIYDFFKGIINLVVCIPVVLSSIFIEICIWLALLPGIYVPNVSDAEDIPNTVPRINTSMEVQDTPAGFISMDCFTAAQEIVNRVNSEAING